MWLLSWRSYLALHQNKKEAGGGKPAGLGPSCATWEQSELAHFTDPYLEDRRGNTCLRLPDPVSAFPRQHGNTDISRYLKRNLTVGSLRTTCHKSQKEGTEKGRRAQWKSVSTHGRHSENPLPITETLTWNPNRRTTCVAPGLLQQDSHWEQILHTRARAHAHTHTHAHTHPTEGILLGGPQTLIQTARRASWVTCEDWRSTFWDWAERLQLWHNLNAVRRKGRHELLFRSHL